MQSFYYLTVVKLPECSLRQGAQMLQIMAENVTDRTEYQGIAGTAKSKKPAIPNTKSLVYQ